MLRDAADKPRSGSFDMVFRFFSAASAGDEILVDSRLAANALAVTVGNGLFSVQLGGGVVGDGSGPGTYTSLADVFRDYAAVWLQLEVGPAGGARETLNPRVRIVAAAYAMNASTAQSALDAANLGGRAPSAFLDTSSTFQTKSGGLKAQEASTNTAGIFANSGSGVSLATAFSGLLASGPVTGGEFYNDSSGSFALLSNGNDGVVGRGQWGGCETCGAGGVFSSGTLYSGQASLSVGDTGLVASGDFAAGIFRESDSGASAYLGYNSTGVAGFAVNPGENPAYFEDSSSGLTWAAVGQAGFKIKGTGGVSFVQNHPFDPTAEIVYTAPEGDEAAVYTRGSARLVNGEARVPLGETFRLVANPDIGLTAHVTPRGAWADLYVASVTTEELVVRSRDGQTPDAAFDYAVWGLRIGFEERPAIRPKERNAPLPSRAPDEALFAARPDLRATTPLARFAAMRDDGAVAGARPLDLDALACARRGDRRGLATGVRAGRSARGARHHGRLAARVDRARPRRDRCRDEAGPDVATRPLEPTTLPASLPGALPAPIAERVEVGDVLAADPLRPGTLVRSGAGLEATVAGIVAGAPGSVFDGEAPLAFAGTIVSVKADATAQPIAAGDLLVASPLPGHAMRAPDGPAAGTVVAKALESLPAGTRMIRALVMSR